MSGHFHRIHVTINVHFISDIYEGHMGANVVELLQKEADEWQFSNRDIVLATDNTSNMAVAAQLRDFVHVRCYAHTLNLACQ